MIDCRRLAAFVAIDEPHVQALVKRRVLCCRIGSMAAWPRITGTSPVLSTIAILAGRASCAAAPADGIGRECPNEEFHAARIGLIGPPLSARMRLCEGAAVVHGGDVTEGVALASLREFSPKNARGDQIRSHDTGHAAAPQSSTIRLASRHPTTTFNRTGKLLRQGFSGRVKGQTRLHPEA